MIFLMTVAFVFIACTTVTTYWCVSVHRREQARREWESVAANLRELDAHLDRAWEAEVRRHHPHP
jgi:predicted amidophosphoribosyltransferase